MPKLSMCKQNRPPGLNLVCNLLGLWSSLLNSPYIPLSPFHSLCKQRNMKTISRNWELKGGLQTCSVTGDRGALFWLRGIKRVVKKNTTLQNICWYIAFYRKKMVININPNPINSKEICYIIYYICNVM